MSSINGIGGIKNLFTEDFSGAKKVRKEKQPQDKIEISNTSKAFAKIESFLN